MEMSQQKYQTKNFQPIKNAKQYHVAQAASQLLKESKKMANGLIEDGREKINSMQKNVQQSVKGYSEGVANQIQARPLTSLLIAGGVGFLLSALVRR